MLISATGIFYILYAFHSVEMYISSLLIFSIILDAVNLSLSSARTFYTHYLHYKMIWNFFRPVGDAGGLMIAISYTRVTGSV